jgi:CRP/FNR family cyclic AMP-dependent transcriptional regulator
MFANSVYSVRLRQKSDGSLSPLAKRVRRKQAHLFESSREICATSGQNAARRPLMQAVNTLARSTLFARLSDEDIARLNALCLWRKVRAGEFFMDEPTDGYTLSVVTNGRVRGLRIINGREIILGDINEGEYFGELSAIDGRPGPAQIVAITDAVVARMPSNAFRDTIYQYPSVCDHVLTDFASRIRTLNDRVSEQISLTARERLCVELLRLSRRTAKDRIAVSPPPSHFEFAARIGGCRETVTKLLNAFERDGLISRSRAAIALTDVPRLKMIAGHAR